MGMQQQQHRKKRIVMILVNALVEWILISLLLLNSLFTYLITKYAHFFGLNLKPPNTDHSQHMCQHYYCSMEEEEEEEEKDIIEEEEELDIVDGVDVDMTFSFREATSEEEFSKEEDVDNHNILQLLNNELDDSLQLIHMNIHCCTHSLRPVPLDLIDSFIFRPQNTLTMDTLHLFQQEHQLHNKDQTETPLQLESSQVSYRDDRQEAQENEAETPTSLDSLHNNNNNNNKLLLLLSEKRDSSSSSSTSVEECLDGSNDKGVTVERLKSIAIAVYAELEEERSASAIAANHTMAMITRLQEEKAAMQMEALQYQRMMEEQAEYDQEALQLLNHLMLNKDKEKDELSKELETMYRENHNTLIQGEHTNDDTRLSINLNRAMIEKHNADSDYIYYDGSQICDDEDLEVMALDCMKHMSELDESLAEFEEEKLSILHQLKALEQKLLMMSGEGSEGRVEDKDIEHLQKETMQSMAKQLLPLLDEAESAEIEMNHHLVEDQFPDDDEKKANKLVDGVEEVDRVYERLKALEDVNEDKQGMNHHLLQEILQNLRDLKTVELQSPE